MTFIDWCNKIVIKSSFGVSVMILIHKTPLLPPHEYSSQHPYIKKQETVSLTGSLTQYCHIMNMLHCTSLAVYEGHIIGFIW